MATILIQYQVKKFADWKKVYESMAEFRTSSGAIASHAYQDASDPNKITVVNKWNTLANAQKFTQSLELKTAMEKAGVLGPPNISFLLEV